MLHAQQCAENICVECRGVAFGGLVSERSRLTLGTCVVDGRVEPAEARYDMVDQVSDIAFATHIGLPQICLCTFCYQIRAPVLSFVRLTPQKHERRTPIRPLY